MLINCYNENIYSYVLTHAIKGYCYVASLCTWLAKCFKSKLHSHKEGREDFKGVGG